MNIYQRLNEIRKEVAYIRKDKKVENYMAVTHDQVTAETRDSFIKHGVLIVPHEIDSAFKETGAVSARGTPSMRFEAKYRIDFVNIDDPKDICSVDFSAHALDFGDKAPGKAHSYATKYAVLKVLQIETGEDEEGRLKEKPINHKSVPSETFESLPPEEQKYLRELADEVLSCKSVDEQVQFLGNIVLDAEEKTALWSLLDSKTRSAIKKASKPVTA